MTTVHICIRQLNAGTGMSCIHPSLVPDKTPSSKWDTREYFRKKFDLSHYFNKIPYDASLRRVCCIESKEEFAFQARGQASHKEKGLGILKSRIMN